MIATPADPGKHFSPALIDPGPPARASTSSCDSEALFRQLVHDHRHRLYRFIVKHIGWGTDAEELTQQAFVEAAHSYASFRGASELSTWLYRLLDDVGPTRKNQVCFSKRLNATRPAGPRPTA